MPNVYVVSEDGYTEPMTRIHCCNEQQELQLILEKNPDLIPGDQISPESAPRWLLVKREMPVPDPSTGADHWSVDFFFVDQEAKPTFVECKRFNDTRARREVVGQMLEYAANGHYYWTKEAIRDYAEETAKSSNASLEEAILSLELAEDESIDAFFDRVQENLREGQVRIVFFLEEAPVELRSLVDFLNKQMERSEVLLVEARQYVRDGVKIVVPTLFGYTEEARMVKRMTTVTKAVTRRKWDEASFFSDARSRLDDGILQTLQEIHEQCRAMQDARCTLTWGTGRDTGSFGLKHEAIGPRTFFTVWSSGEIRINFGWLDDTETALAFRDSLKGEASEKLGLAIGADYEGKYPSFSILALSGKVPLFGEILRSLIARHARPDQSA